MTVRRNYLSLGRRRLGFARSIRNMEDFISERAFHGERTLVSAHFTEDDQILRNVALLESEGLIQSKHRPILNKGLREMTAADGIYYRDLRLPFIVADAAAVTITTAVCTPIATANFGFLPANYFGFPGKLVKMTQFGKMTTGATPGNLTASYSVSNADNTRLTSSAAAALILNKTNLSFWSFGYCRARTLGTTGTAFVWGLFNPHVGLVASTAQPILIPDSAGVTTTFDSTATQGFNLQVARSGSTAETITTQELTLEALN